MVGVAPVKAVTLTNQLGEQDFAHGAAVSQAEIGLAGVDEPSPFDGWMFGDDPFGGLGEFEYTHSFDLGGLNPVSAFLTIGLLDHDSFTLEDDTIDVFFDGILQDDTAFRGISGDPATASVVTVPVDVALLLDGQLTVTFKATRPAPGSVGNSIAGDFSKLVIEAQQPQTSVPEPTSVLGLFTVGIATTSLLKRQQKHHETATDTKSR